MARFKLVSLLVVVLACIATAMPQNDATTECPCQKKQDKQDVITQIVARPKRYIPVGGLAALSPVDTLRTQPYPHPPKSCCCNTGHHCNNHHCKNHHCNNHHGNNHHCNNHHGKDHHHSAKCSCSGSSSSSCSSSSSSSSSCSSS